MTRQLKVGDKVKRVYPYNNRFVVGSIHIVSSIMQDEYDASLQNFTVRGESNGICIFKPNIWQLIEEEVDMKLEDLKVGMRVELRDGTQCLVVNWGDNLQLLINSSGVVTIGEWWDSDLKRISKVDQSDRDIVKVWSNNHYGKFSSDLSKPLTSAPIWTRKESKDVDVEEAMQVLKGHYGCDVNLVGG